MDASSQARWDRYFIQLAMAVATKSKDPSTKVGCVLVGPEQQVLSTGYNGFPRGVRDYDRNHMEDKSILDPDRWARPAKYAFVEHAERNAVFNAARHGIALRGAVAYLNFEPKPCEGCARALIQSGIIAVVGPTIPFPGAGAGTHYDVDNIPNIVLHESGVRVRRVHWEAP